MKGTAHCIYSGNEAAAKNRVDAVDAILLTRSADHTNCTAQLVCVRQIVRRKHRQRPRELLMTPQIMNGAARGTLTYWVEADENDRASLKHRTDLELTDLTQWNNWPWPFATSGLTGQFMIAHHYACRRNIDLYTVSQKVDHKLMAATSSTINRFSKSFRRWKRTEFPIQFT